MAAARGRQTSAVRHTTTPAPPLLQDPTAYNRHTRRRVRIRFPTLRRWLRPDDRFPPPCLTSSPTLSFSIPPLSGSLSRLSLSSFFAHLLSTFSVRTSCICQIGDGYWYLEIVLFALNMRLTRAAHEQVFPLLLEHSVHRPSAQHLQSTQTNHAKATPEPHRRCTPR